MIACKYGVVIGPNWSVPVYFGYSLASLSDSVKLYLTDESVCEALSAVELTDASANNVGASFVGEWPGVSEVWYSEEVPWANVTGLASSM